MMRLRVHCFSISIDGYGAGPSQSLDHPLGLGDLALHEWIFPTRTFRSIQGEEGGTTDASDRVAARGLKNIGAWILGRNMFGPVRGTWADEHWKGWWGEDPPYHVVVLTNHPRKSFSMEGGTTFHVVTTGIHAALNQATEAANGKDIRLQSYALKLTRTCTYTSTSLPRISTHAGLWRFQIISDINLDAGQKWREGLWVAFCGSCRLESWGLPYLPALPPRCRCTPLWMA
ncbi:MAG: hypothetical protein DYH03_14710 [Nitrospira sp. NTP1]|nr:hypothetical protein [Nitrospira sp. NTP1]